MDSQTEQSETQQVTAVQSQESVQSPITNEEEGEHLLEQQAEDEEQKVDSSNKEKPKKKYYKKKNYNRNKEHSEKSPAKADSESKIDSTLATCFELLYTSESELDITEGINQLKKFILNNKPTYQALLEGLEDYFENNQEILEKSIANIEMICKCFQATKANSIIQKSLLTVISTKDSAKPAIKAFKETKEYTTTFPESWKYVHLDSLSTYLEIFELSKLIDSKHVAPEITRLLSENKVGEAVKVLSNFSNFSGELAPLIISSLTNNKDASKAADIIKQFKLPVSEFQEVEIRLKKNALRFHLKSSSWYFVLDLFQKNTEILAYAVEDLVHSNQLSEAQSILHYNPEVLSLVKKVETLPALNAAKPRVLENILITKDSFSKIK